MTKSEDKSSISDDIVVTLSFNFLNQLTTLSLASAGGAITLLQISITSPKAKLLAYIATGVLFFAATLALQAQQILVERIRSNSSAYTDLSFKKLKLSRTVKMEERMTAASFIMFGIGIALLMGSLLYK